MESGAQGPYLRLGIGPLQFLLMRYVVDADTHCDWQEERQACVGNAESSRSLPSVTVVMQEKRRQEAEESAAAKAPPSLFLFCLP
jgi:hypothetical protein